MVGLGRGAAVGIDEDVAEMDEAEVFAAVTGFFTTSFFLPSAAAFMGS